MNVVLDFTRNCLMLIFGLELGSSAAEARRGLDVPRLTKPGKFSEGISATDKDSSDGSATSAARSSVAEEEDAGFSRARTVLEQEQSWVVRQRRLFQGLRRTRMKRTQSSPTKRGERVRSPPIDP